jgi:hypothetical protein
MAAGPGSIRRRTLIKGAAAAGVAAWTAPLIVESLVSPAAAASISGCQRIHLGVTVGDVFGNCNSLPTSSSAWATTCDGSFPSLTTACGSALTSLPTNVDTLANLGITRTACGLFSTTLKLSKTNCSWVAGQAHSTVSGCNTQSSINNGTAGNRTISFSVGSLVDDYYLVITCT